MEQPLPTRPRTHAAPSFHLIERQRPRPIAILLAILVAAGGLYAVAFGLSHSKRAHLKPDEPSATRSAGGPSGSAPDKDKDDPNQVDTIVLGDAADAPVPARKGDRSTGPTDVHPTIMIRLPRYGEQFGLIPDTPAGHLLYQWLAAFNQSSYPALAHILPNGESAYTTAAQLFLRGQTGGFSLLSAKEVQPGVLVFRLRDQTPGANEVLGTLQMRKDSNPAAIASFSLRAIPQTHNITTSASPPSAHSPQ